jgi:hypothetical protein
MIFGNRKRLCRLMMAMLLAHWTTLNLAQGRTPITPDPSELIASIKKPTPATIEFIEVRYSRLLKQPTIVSGQLGFLGNGHFDRVVANPYRERTEINNESVRVTREGENDRSFALSRAPELRAMLQAFSALLGGDLAVIEQDFRLTTLGDTQDWTLELAPLDARIQRRLQRVSIIGKNETPQCFSIYTREGGVSIMLLGPLASLNIAPTIHQDALLQHCRSGH